MIVYLVAKTYPFCVNAKPIKLTLCLYESGPDARTRANWFGRLARTQNHASVSLKNKKAQRKLRAFTFICLVPAIV